MKCFYCGNDATRKASWADREIAVCSDHILTVTREYSDEAELVNSMLEWEKL